MTEIIDLVVPDLGDFDDVEVIEILVAVGDSVAIEDPLVTLETDKATMDIPASHAGVISGIAVSVGGKVSAGDIVATIDAVAIDDEAGRTVVIAPEVQKEILAAATGAQESSQEASPVTAPNTSSKNLRIQRKVLTWSS